MSKLPATEADSLEHKATVIQQFQERRSYYILVGLGLTTVSHAQTGFKLSANWPASTSVFAADSTVEMIWVSPV